MSFILQRILFIGLFSGILVSLFIISVPFGISGIIVGALIIAFAVRHRKNKSKARWQRHSEKRAGETYDEAQNQKKGDKNKKYQKPANPNKKGNTSKGNKNSDDSDTNENE